MIDRRVSTQSFHQGPWRLRDDAHSSLFSWGIVPRINLIHYFTKRWSALANLFLWYWACFCPTEKHLTDEPLELRRAWTLMAQIPQIPGVPALCTSTHSAQPLELQLQQNPQMRLFKRLKERLSTTVVCHRITRTDFHHKNISEDTLGRVHHVHVVCV